MECEIEIRLKLPSLNEYINACRTNRYKAAQMKQEIEQQIICFLFHCPRFKNPVSVHFHWIEGNRKRDLDNVAFGKKFILDALVKAGKLKDDNRNCVTGFIDTFSYDKPTRVIVRLSEVEQ